METSAKNKQQNVANRGIKKVEAYRKVFSSVEGQLVLNDLMAAHGMLSPTYGGKVHDMLHKEGERNVILRILKLVGTDPKDLRERIENYERDLAE